MTEPSRLDDVPEEEEEGSWVLDDSAQNTSTYAAPFQEWKVAQDLVREDPDKKSKMDEAEELLKNTQAPLDNDIEHNVEKEQVPSEEDEGVPRTQKQKKRIALLSILAILLTILVVLIAALSISRGGGSSSSNESASQEDAKDPPDDVTAPPPMSIAPIVPGSPTMAPNTQLPTASPITDRPTLSPVLMVDANGLLDRLTGVLPDPSPLLEESSIYNKAYRSVGNYDDVEQRFAVATLNYAVQGMFATLTIPTCDWFGITCENDIVTEISWPNQALSGSLPTMGISLLTGLTSLDLAENELVGSIPTVLYEWKQLEYLYLHQNQLLGTLSSNIGKLENLRRLYLGGNQLTGMLPQELGSPGLGGANVRPLRKWKVLLEYSLTLFIEYVSLYDNQFVGPIPRNWNLRELFYLDLGKNKLSGDIPSDWTVGRNTMNRLRLLYLDENNMGGTLAANFGEVGKGRLHLLSIHTNNFVGEMPVFQNYTNFLNRLEIHNNAFTSMSRFQCAQIVFNGGEMVQMKVDCEICNCLFFCAPDECF